MNTKNEGCNAIFIGKAFVLVRQLKDKTIASRKDNLARARQLQLPIKPKAWQKDNLKASKTIYSSVRQLYCLGSVVLSARQSNCLGRAPSVRQSKIVLKDSGIVCRHSLGQTIKDCLPGNHKSSVGQSTLSWQRTHGQTICLADF